MPRRAQNERVPIWKQFKLEFVEGNKISDFLRCALRQQLCDKSPMHWWPTPNGGEIAVPEGRAVPFAEWIALH
jgi:hypothetical protein